MLTRRDSNPQPFGYSSRLQIRTGLIPLSRTAERSTIELRVNKICYINETFVNLIMMVTTNQNTLVQFRFHFIPRFCHSADSEIFLSWVDMMKLQGSDAAGISTHHTLASLVIDRPSLGSLTPCYNRVGPAWPLSISVSLSASHRTKLAT